MYKAAEFSENRLACTISSEMCNTGSEQAFLDYCLVSAAAIAACDVTAPSAAAAVQLSDHVWCTRMRANHRHRESWDCIVTMMSNNHNDPESVITQLRQQRDSAKRSCSSPGTTTSQTAASRAGRWWQPASTCKTTNAHSDAYT